MTTGWDDISNAPLAGISDEPSYRTLGGFPVCDRCGMSARNMERLVCRQCEAGTRLLLTPADRKLLREMKVKP
jgi:hypothetical protein